MPRIPPPPPPARCIVHAHRSFIIEIGALEKRRRRTGKARDVGRAELEYRNEPVDDFNVERIVIKLECGHLAEKIRVIPIIFLLAVIEPLHGADFSAHLAT